MTNKSRHPFPKRVSVFFRLTEGVLCAEEIVRSVIHNIPK